jgi:hypothetical protein
MVSLWVWLPVVSGLLLICSDSMPEMAFSASETRSLMVFFVIPDDIE